MSSPAPSFNSLRAFEAAARLGSFAKAAEELLVTPSALSHQIKALEAQLGLLLFERRSRAIALTREGAQLYPGLRAGFDHIQKALLELKRRKEPRILVVSTPPGLTARWLAPRLFRFAELHPKLDLRISSSAGVADFQLDGVDAAIRNMPATAARAAHIHYEKLIDLDLTPVCSPRLLRRIGDRKPAREWLRAPLVHDDSLSGRANLPTWPDWLRTAKIKGVDVSRGLRLSSADHALDAAVEGAGVLLTQTILAHDDLRTGRLVMPAKLVLPTHRAYYFACLKRDLSRPAVAAFRAWLLAEIALLDLPQRHDRSDQAPA
jgi:LysR family glycine cleavage system transcriptional activator